MYIQLMMIKALITLVITQILILSVGYSQEVSSNTLVEALPAIAKALNKGEGKVEKPKDEKKLKHPQVIDKHKVNQCVSFVCTELGTFGCDSDAEIVEVKSICKKNIGVSCMKFICDKLGAFGCDSYLKIMPVIESCSEVKDTSCMNYTCNMLGSFACDSIDELLEVTTSCRGADTGCVKQACNVKDSFGCDSMYEINSIIGSCRK